MLGKYKGFDRVTEALSPFSGYDQVPPDILQKAKDRGTLIHKAIHEKITGLGEWSDVPARYNGYMASFSNYWRASPLSKLISVETRYGHEELKYTGQVDYIAHMGDDIVALDWKTSRREGDTWKYQGAAYVEMLRSEGIKVSKCYFIHLREDGSFPTIYEYTANHEKNFDIFIKCLDLYRLFFKKNNLDTMEEQ